MRWWPNLLYYPDAFSGGSVGNNENLKVIGVPRFEGKLPMHRAKVIMLD
jgi:hypothetical protein